MAEQFITDLSKISKSTLALMGEGFSNNKELTAEYLIKRGGVNPVTGQFGDSYNPNTDLTDAEYLAALQGKTGTGQGSALNIARAKKAYDYALSIAKTDEEKTAARMEYDSLLFGNATANPNDATFSSTTTDTSTSSTSSLPTGVTIVSTYADPTTGDVTAVLSNGTTKVLAPSGAASSAKKSAYDLLYQQFNDLGIGGLVPELKTFIEEGVSPSEFTLRLRGTEAYKKRFAGNAQRIAKGLRALSEAEYIGLEDQYQNVMRQYGLPESYYTRGEMGRQEGFEKFIAGDVSASELEDRISTAQKRVLNANPEVAQALKTFYPGISNGDILAYTLDPTKAIEDIKRKVTAAEIGGAAARAGLTTNVSDAEYLRNYGVTKEQADQGYGVIAGGLQRGSQLASMYGENPYTQATAEQEIFNVPGAVEARKQRQKITGLEKATFSGQSGISQGALVRDRAGAY